MYLLYSCFFLIDRASDPNDPKISKVTRSVPLFPHSQKTTTKKKKHSP